MIRAFEAQVAAWVAAIAAESGELFGSPAVTVQMSRAEPASGAPEWAGPGEFSGTFLVTGTLTLEGGDTAVLSTDPAGAPVHQVDLLALAVLTRLRERPAAGPDGSSATGGGCRGQVTARAGTSQAELRWTAVEAGQPVELAPTPGGGDSAAGAASAPAGRRWEIPLKALLAFRLTTPPEEGGRIERIIPRLQTREP